MAENEVVIKLNPEQMAHLETAFMTALVKVEAERDEARAWARYMMAERDEAIEVAVMGMAGSWAHNCRCAPIPNKTTTQTEFTILFSKQLSEGVSAHFQAALANLLGCYDPGWLLTCRDVQFDADGEEVCDAETQT